MSYIVTKYPQGAFSMVDVVSTDIEKSKKFLTSLFGWTSEDIPTGHGNLDYTKFSLDGKIVAGGVQALPSDMHSFCKSYVTVENVDEVVAKVEKLGGKVTWQPTDAMNAGRMAAIQDPTGAALYLWQPKEFIGASVINAVGAMCWNELYTKDIEKAKQFYSDLFGWTYEIDQKNDGYVMIKNNGRSNGGIYPITPEMGTMPPNWTVYFTVKNMEESLAKVKELGGTTYMDPKAISIGKIAMVADPAGVSFMFIEMSITPDTWQD